MSCAIRQGSRKNANVGADGDFAKWQADVELEERQPAKLEHQLDLAVFRNHLELNAHVVSDANGIRDEGHGRDQLRGPVRMGLLKLPPYKKSPRDSSPHQHPACVRFDGVSDVYPQTQHERGD